MNRQTLLGKPKMFEARCEEVHLSLPAELGDIIVRWDQDCVYVHNGGTTGTMDDWTPACRQEPTTA